MTFDPWTETWTRYADMPHGRWYPTLTELPDGRVLIVGGWDETGGRRAPGDPGGPPTMVNDQDVEVFDPSMPAGGQATTVVSQLPPNGRRRRPTPGRTTRASASTRTCSCCPSTTARGAGRRQGAGGRARASTTRRSSTRGTWIWTDIVGRAASPTPASRASRATAPGAPPGSRPAAPDGGTKVVLLGGSDTGAPAPGAGHRHAAARDGRGPRPERPGRAAGSIDPALALNDGPRPLQHRPAARRVDLHQRRRLRPQERHASTPTRSTGPSSTRPAPAGATWATSRTRAPTTPRRCCCPTGVWRRPATTATSRPSATSRSPGTRTGADLEPALPVRRPAPGGHLRPAERALRRPVPGRRRRAPAAVDARGADPPRRRDPRQRHDPARRSPST